MGKLIRDEILGFLRSVSDEKLRPGAVMSIPCDLYDETTRTGFVVHEIPGENFDGNLSDYYHSLADRAEHAGCHLIQIWEDLWLVKKQIIQSRLLSAFGKTVRVFARKTEIREISRQESNDFLNKNHLQGMANAGYKYGLFYDGVMMAVATFSKSRPIDRNGVIYRSHELIRYCSLLNTTVVGGLDKLLKHFIKEWQPDDIMTYADRDWSDGSVYRKLGFQQTEVTPSHIFWVDPESGMRIFPNKVNKLIHARGWVPQSAEIPDGTAVLKANGFRAVSNSGNLKFVLLLKSFS